MNYAELLEHAEAVLLENDQGEHTIPAKGLYPHQWLWDSCFIAIGIRHYDVERAQKEILRLLSGQWTNGMLPHMVLSPDKHARDNNIMWRSWLSPYSPDDIGTSGMTQPPVVAEAVVRIGEKLSKSERYVWYRKVYPALLRYHQWLYADRDPHDEGLVLIVHPWESGLDNSPPWLRELHEHLMPAWIRTFEALKLDAIINIFRRDTKYVPAEQRLSAVEALTYYHMQRRLRRKGYDTNKVLPHSLFSMEDLTFNCIFIRANTHLQAIAKAIGEELPSELSARMHKTRTTLEQLWDPYSAQYYSRNFVTHRLVKEPTFASLMPLYAGCISPERAEHLVRQLTDTKQFGTPFPVPTVPINSGAFQEFGYWQGPVWININWLLTDGLRRYGYDKLANAVASKSLDLVGASGSWEYFSPLSGQPAGAQNFSWTAALTIDFIHQAQVREAAEHKRRQAAAKAAEAANQLEVG